MSKFPSLMSPQINSARLADPGGYETPVGAQGHPGDEVLELLHNLADRRRAEACVPSANLAVPVSRHQPFRAWQERDGVYSGHGGVVRAQYGR